VDVKNILFKHFEKLILLVALAVLGLFGAKRFVFPPPTPVEELKADIAKYAVRIETNLKKSKAPPLPRLKVDEGIRKMYTPKGEVGLVRIHTFNTPKDIVHELTIMARKPWKFPIRKPIKWDSITCDKARMEVQRGPEGGMILMPKGVGETTVRFEDAAGVRHVVKITVTEFVAEPQVNPPVIESAEQVDGLAVLTWRANENIDKRSPPTEFRIYRRPAGTGPEQDKVIKTVKIEGKVSKGLAKKLHKFEDKDVEFGRSYVYSITSFSASAKPPESKKAVAEKPVTIPEDVVFDVASVVPDGSRAQLKVFKWTREKRWQGPKSFFVKPGEIIGGVDNRTKTDYTTGAILLFAEATKAKKIAFGRVVMMPVFRVVYQDKQGVVHQKLSDQNVRTSPPWKRFSPTDEAPQRGGRKPREKPKERRPRERELLPEEEVPPPEDLEPPEPERIR